jgi:VHS domain
VSKPIHLSSSCKISRNVHYNCFAVSKFCFQCHQHFAHHFLLQYIVSRRAEVIFLLRRKLSSPKARTVYLTLSLVEALVKNGGNKVFAAVGNEAFMKEMAKVARKYNGRSGSENMEVSELSLDMIQGWGEAFLSKQREFPAFSKTYHDLRKEGIQFKAQYDVNRVPIFTPVGAHAGEAMEDSGILKAAMEASMYSAGPSRSQTTGNPMSTSGATAKPKHSTEGTSSKLVQSTDDVTQSMATSINILKEMISVCESAPALRDNEIADEVVVQLRSLQGAMTSVIDFELSQDGQVL